MVFEDNNPLKEIYGIDDIIEAENVKVEGYPFGTEAKAYVPEDKPAAMEEVRASLKGCQKCRLGATRKNIVFGEGNVNARLMFVGEGPGADEDATGRPFVGRSGQLLTKMIEAMGLKRSEVFIGNIVKCRPPDNRNPFNDEAEACIGYLTRQISIIDPEYIICLGSVAVSFLLRTSAPISRLRGKWQKFGNYKVMPTFHPSYLLRSPNKKVEAWQDLQTVMGAMGLEIPKK